MSSLLQRGGDLNYYYLRHPDKCYLHQKQEPFIRTYLSDWVTGRFYLYYLYYSENYAKKGLSFLILY